MKENLDSYGDTFPFDKIKKGGKLQGKVNSLLAELLEKEEEISLYKNRLTELEEAFYYNLELITERDLELGVLEKQLAVENEQLKEIIRERDELEDLVKVIDEKYSRKIQQLETRLALKEEEINDLQRENISNIENLKKLLQDSKQNLDKKISKMTAQFESQKNELMKNYREEIEEKEKYYLNEIDSLTEELEQEKARAEEQIINFKYLLEKSEALFVEKEKEYLEEMQKISESYLGKADKEVQCGFLSQGVEKTIQAEPEITAADSQTTINCCELEEEYKAKINFLQEQNDVLKYIVKDLKKNREISSKAQQPPGCECLSIKAEIEQVNKKFESEINNLKEILEKEQKEREEEDVVIKSLETTVTCLKEKLLMGLQEKLKDFSGDDICAHVYNREIQTEIQVTLLEEKLCKKIDALLTTAEEDRRKLQNKLEEFRTECVEKIEKYMTKREEPTEMNSENLLKKIRQEIQKLENKIESDMRNMVRNNCESNKCYKNIQTRDAAGLYVKAAYPEVLPCELPRKDELGYPRGSYYRNDTQNRSPRKRLGAEKPFREFTNNLVIGR